MGRKIDRLPRTLLVIPPRRETTPRSPKESERVYRFLQRLADSGIAGRTGPDAIEHLLQLHMNHAVSIPTHKEVVEMAYELTWVEDPYGDAREAVISAVFESAVVPSVNALPEQRAERFERTFAAACRAAEEIGGYLHVSTAAMRALLAEMEVQGISARAPEVVAKLRNRSGCVSPDEIGLLLSGPFSFMPARLGKPQASVLESAMTRAASKLGMAMRGEVEVLRSLTRPAWIAIWIRWISFLDEAQSHGGFAIA
jgi:hypothetical protein